ncbi:MAG: hypothetical protein ABI216_19610, partial [Devosia sp.]
ATNVFDRTTPFTLRGFNVLPVVPGGRSDAAAGNAADLARRAVAAFRDFEADCIVAETNHDMVKAVLAQVDASVPVRTIHDVMAARERCKGFT